MPLQTIAKKNMRHRVSEEGPSVVLRCLSNNGGTCKAWGLITSTKLAMLLVVEVCVLH